MLPPSEFQTIKQPRGSKVCVACVAAMATGRTLAEVEAVMHPSLLPDGSHYYRTRELLGYLGHAGIHVGLVFQIGDGKGMRCTGFDLQVETTLEGHPAILDVLSPSYANATHLVFWDGHDVRDPIASVPDTTPLRLYKVREVMPLVYIDDTKELDPEILLKLAAE